MAIRSADARPRGPTAATMVLGCFALFGVAVAQPLFDLLSRNPAFLLEHEVGGRQVWMLVVASWVAPAAVTAALIFTLHRLWRPAALTVFLALTAILGAATVLPLFARELPAWLALALGLACGGLLAWWSRRASGQLVLKLGALAPLVFTALFLVHPEIRGTIWPATSGDTDRLETSGPLRSFVLVILDEIPVTNLLRASDEIDADRFPNLARLRDDSIWYRNCTTVSGYTHRSIPAILTGRYVRDDRAPSLTNYPDNLVTLVQEDMLVVAEETLTALSPDQHKRADPGSRAHQLDLLFWDSGVVLLHRILPPDFARSLPQVDAQWGGFGRGGFRSGHPGKFLSWIDRLQKGFKPTAGVIHVVYPHMPYVHYPSGTRYSARTSEPFKIGGRWVDDALAPRQAWVRARLQLEHADTLIGAMIEKLESAGLYDEAVIAVTADHGASYRAGDFQRRISDGNRADILPVPFFLKLPGGERAGSTDERLVTTVDIVPTLAEAAGFVVPWETDGRAILREDAPGRPEVVFFDADLEREMRFTLDQLDGQAATLERMRALFDGVDAANPSLGPYRDLVGREVEEFGPATVSPATIRLSGTVKSRNVVAGEFRGFLQSPTPLTAPVHIAVVRGGRIVAVTRTLLLDAAAASAEWMVLIPEHEVGAGTPLFYEIERGEPPRLRLLSRQGDPPSVVGRRLGISDVPGVEVSGLLPRRAARDGRAALWTGPLARFVVPVQEADAIVALRLEVLECSPTGSKLDLRVAGRSVFTGRIDAGPWERKFALPTPLPVGVVEIEIEAEAFVPAMLDPSSGDERELGVLLAGLWLLDE